MELVLYWGRKHWSSAGDIRKFFKRKHLSDKAWKYIDNEKLHVFEMRYLSKEVISRFKSDMRIVLEYLTDNPDNKCLKQKVKHVEAVLGLMKLLSEDNRYQEMLEYLKRTNQLERPEEGGDWTMCRLFEESWDKGKSVGMLEGIMQGMQALISTCKELNLSFEWTADKLKEKFSLEDAEVEKNMKLYW